MIEFYKKFSSNIVNFGYVTKFHKTAVAVSGGSDSMALLEFTRHWAAEYNIEIVAITVNHNLRASAVKEVEFVKEFCNSHSIKCFALECSKSELSGNNIQQKARLARYQLITSLCKELKIFQLFTGHHKDDNVENFIMRLLKGSGPLGFGKNNEYFYNNIRILRPLHNFRKDECKLYLNSLNVEWIEDDSNYSTKYLRNDIRITTKSILDKLSVSYDQVIDRLSNTQDHYGEVIDIIKKSFINLLAKYCCVETIGYAVVNYEAIKLENKYLQNLLLSYLLTIISGKNYLPKSKKIEYIINNAGEKKNNFFVLHGCRIIFENDKIFILRELADILKNTKESHFIKGVVFDNRFEITFNGKFLSKQDNLTVSHLTVSHLTEKDYQLLKDKIDFSMYFLDTFKYKKYVIQSLPVLKNGDKVVAISHSNYYDIEASYLKNLDIKVSFVANFFSKLVHY